MHQLLRSKVIPWTSSNEASHFIVARPEMDAATLPPGVTLSRRKLKGKRIIVRNQRRHAGQRVQVADWPNDNLHELALPKLACVVNGEADYLLGEYSLRCGEGTFILIPPRMPHQRTGPFLQGDRLRSGTCLLLHAYAYSHGVFVWTSTSREGQHINSFDENYLIPNMTAVAAFTLMMQEAVESKTGFEDVCNGFLSAFFSIVAREIEAGHYMRSSPNASNVTSSISSESFADQIKEYLSANCHKPLKLADAAAHFYMSTALFTRRVRRETGATFVELLTAARIERAKELLRETDWTFAAIASLCSFKSPSYFLQLFHQRVGCTPIEYRKKRTSNASLRKLI
jgi:AraC-like DNA-binding protein